MFFPQCPLVTIPSREIVRAFNVLFVLAFVVECQGKSHSQGMDNKVYTNLYQPVDDMKSHIALQVPNSSISCATTKNPQTQ